MKWLSWLILLAACLLSSCSQTAEPPEKTQWIDPSQIQPGPIQHETLTEDQLQRIRALQATFAEVDQQPLEKWIDDFKRDLDPDRELQVWERMAKAYQRYCENRSLSLAVKKEVFSVVLLRSSSSAEETLEHVQLRELSAEDAQQIARSY
jgi:hypothetical protein